MSDIKPCPFCGSKAETKVFDGQEHYTCPNFRCPIISWEKADVWNTRPIEDALNARIAELEEKQRWIPVSERLPEAERKEFCPNCESETPCTHEAELFVCDICGEDFAKYIVSRNCNVSDVSMTQDVTTPRPPEVQE